MNKALLSILTVGNSLGVGDEKRVTPVGGALLGGGFEGGATYVIPMSLSVGGAAGLPVGLHDDADNVAALTGATTTTYQGVVARLTGYDSGGNNWDRVRVQSDAADGNATGVGHLSVVSHGEMFNGLTWDRQRSNSASVLSQVTQPFGVLVAPPAEWTVNSEPAVSTQATATKAAGAAGVRHVCRSLHFSLAAVAAQTIIYARVRDGAAGVGTVLWSQAIILAAGSAIQIQLSGLNILGSMATAMTFEWSGAPVASNFQTAGGTGYSTI